MPGIYVHIPFCKQKCFYCDFYKTLETDKREDFVSALLRELEMRKTYLDPAQNIETLYFGGGTPSVLSITELRRIIKAIKSNFSFVANPEITLEVNPDDITDAFLKSIKKEGVNRLSIGIQSFSDNILSMLNRRHNAKQSLRSVEMAREAGFDNISVDLIYGIPGLSAENWKKELETVFKLDVEHISAYHLTIEKNTVFGKMKDLGELDEIPEEVSEEQFAILTQTARDKGYVHYEISNISKEAYISRHNSNYWKQVSYLGLGPSAHSFNGYSREWNIADLDTYIQRVTEGEAFSEKEELDERIRYNEYVMTSLRTMWGIDLNYLETSFSKEMHDYLLNMSARFMKYGMLTRNKSGCVILTEQGKMISDNIISELMMV
ncbi:MAG: radical SAM family heme chaperone HemW [Marinilabiliaceae bacterium]|jgi:oxygen-independent coproporphyrinogen-3 oxidase|nr:radical SAM family heme chaperone HemW [Marinilabiliaceae bacterium]